MKYTIDMHIHTEASKDSKTRIEVIAQKLKKRGVNCAIVTDHDGFTIDKVKKVDGVTFFPGVEFTTDRGHLLGLFMNGFEKPEYNGKKCSFYDAANIIHKYGGLCFLAHPFEYLSKTVDEVEKEAREISPYLDGIEVFNCRAVNKRHNANDLAKALQAELNLCASCGSDGHTPTEYGGAHISVECDSEEKIPNEILAGRLEMYGSCVNRINMAKSQLIKRCKRKEGIASYITGVLYFGVCIAREAAARIRGENKKCRRL